MWCQRWSSPLHFAAEHGKYETVEILLLCGADVNGRTKVPLAAPDGSPDTVRVLGQIHAIGLGQAQQVSGRCLGIATGWRVAVNDLLLAADLILMCSTITTLLVLCFALF